MIANPTFKCGEEIKIFGQYIIRWQPYASYLDELLLPSKNSIVEKTRNKTYYEM